MIADPDAGTVNDVTDVVEPAEHVHDLRPTGDDATWLVPLRGEGAPHDDAVRRLHELLLRAARHEVHRRAAAMGVAGSSELPDLAMQCADDALVAILARLDGFEGRSAFTTWAYKFAIHVSGVAVRRLAWRGRELPTSDETLERLVRAPVAGPSELAEQRERLDGIIEGIGLLTPRQRDVLLALCVGNVPIDVLAERLGSSRGAIYKTLHDARVALRRRIGEEQPGGNSHG